VEWSDYNQSLIRRGEILLGFDVIDNWHQELQHMNKGKVGEPFHYPNTFLLLLGYAKAYFHLPYRQTEGIVKAHAGSKIPSIPNYTTISRRINRLDIKIDGYKQKEKDDEYIIVAIDSTGIKITNRGEWMRKKWNMQNRKGYLKIHLAVDIKSKKILSVKVTDEHKHDNQMLPELVNDIPKENGKKISKVMSDGAYDSNSIFQFLANRGILPCIRVRKNSKVKNTNPFFRNLSVIAQRNDFSRWRDSVSYGWRWIVETAISTIKRMFGEYVYSVKYDNMVKEVMLKIALYNRLRAIV
jgi:hypothetical protein